MEEKNTNRTLRRETLTSILTIAEDALLEKYYKLLKEKGIKAKGHKAIKNLTVFNRNGNLNVDKVKSLIDWLESL